MKPAWAAILLTWLVTAAVAVVGARSLGARVREQIVRRDAEILQAMARTQAQSDDTDGLLAGEPFAVFVTIGRFDGIVAARMYDSNGLFLASVPDHVREADVPPPDLAILREGRTVSRFRENLPVDELFLGTNAAAPDGRGATFPAVEVLIPLPGPGGQGVAGLAGFVVVAAVIGLKAVIHAHIGSELYNLRVAELQAGEGFDRLGGYLMAADPATLKLSELIAKHVLPAL